MLWATGHLGFRDFSFLSPVALSRTSGRTKAGPKSSNTTADQRRRAMVPGDQQMDQQRTPNPKILQTIVHVNNIYVILCICFLQLPAEAESKIVVSDSPLQAQWHRKIAKNSRLSLGRIVLCNNHFPVFGPPQMTIPSIFPVQSPKSLFKKKIGAVLSISIHSYVGGAETGVGGSAWETKWCEYLIPAVSQKHSTS